jgi:hypothetical protein
LSEKGWEEIYAVEREREREIDRVLLWMGYSMGNKLDHWTNIYYS